MHQRNSELLDRKIRQYLLPAIMMKLALQLGTVVDGILVGNLLGTDAMSAITYSSPVLAVLQIPGYFLGNGGAVVAAILLGRRQKEEARKVFSFTFLVTAIAAAAFVISAFFLSHPLAHALTGGNAMEAGVEAYIFASLAGSPGFCLGLLLSCYFAVDSHPQLAGNYFIISNAVNLVLDFVFLKFTPLGLTGAALSSMIGFTVGLVVLIPYIRSPKRMLALAMPRVDIEKVKNILKTGLPYLMFLLISLARSLLMIEIIKRLLDGRGMTVYTVCGNAEFVLVMLVGGLMGVIPNIAGTLYGEKDYYGIHVLCRKLLRYGFILAGILMVLVLIFAKQFTMIFGVTDPQLQEVMVLVLRIYAFSMPFNLWNYFGSQYYGSVEKPTLATIITILENGVILVPAAIGLIMLSQSAGGNGYAGFGLAFVASESLTALFVTIYRRLKYRKQSFLLIPDKNPGICLDFTIQAEDEEVSKVPVEIRTFCGEHSSQRELSNRIAVCAEEMAHNIVSYGGKKSQWIDICLTIAPSEDGGQETFLLRLRDNGIHFDPTTYVSDRDEFDIHGIELVKKLAKDVTYVRAMDLNNTTITV